MYQVGSGNSYSVCNNDLIDGLFSSISLVLAERAPLMVIIGYAGNSTRIFESIPTFLSSRLPHTIVYPIPAVAAATCGRRCGVFGAVCRGSGRTILTEL